MRRIQFSVLAACLGLYAGAAQAATFNFSDSIARNSSADYAFQLNAETIDTYFITSSRAYFLDSTNPWDPFGTHWLDGESDISCATLNCVNKYYDPVSGSYAAIYSSFTNGTLNIHVENYLHEFDVCEPGGQKYCALKFYGAPTLYVRATYSGDSVGVSITRGAIPEPTTWAMMIAGFGMAGVALRRRPRPALDAA